MSFDFRIGPQDDGDAKVLRSNDEAIDGWQVLARRLSGRTQESYGTHIRLFLSRLQPGTLVTDLTPAMWRSYLTHAATTCRFLRRHQAGKLSCQSGLDLDGCGTRCDGYEAMRISTLDNHARAISSLYSYLDFENYIPINFVPQVYKDFKKTIGRTTEEDPKYYCPTLEEVRTLIAGTDAEPRRTMYILMAKTGTRIEETSSIGVTRKEFDRDAGTILITGRRKRKGNPYLVIDPELDRHLESYLEWRDRVAQPTAKTLIVTPHGEPLARSNLGKLNERWWQADAIRLGLQAADAPRGQRWHSHSMRHFFSDYIHDQGIQDVWYHVLRGDKVKGTLGAYTEHKRLDRIRQQYMRHAPVLAM